MVAPEISSAPAVALRQLSVRRSAVAGVWTIRWSLQNTGGELLEIISVRLPHGQFKSRQQQFEPPLKLPAGGAVEFHIQVDCAEPPGLVTENAFLIFNVTWLNEDWRIFARVKVVVNARGEPQAATELVTTQKVGFSGVPN